MSLSGLDVSPVFLHHSASHHTSFPRSACVSFLRRLTEHVTDWQSLKDFASADISEVSWRHLSGRASLLQSVCF